MANCQSHARDREQICRGRAIHRGSDFMDQMSINIEENIAIKRLVHDMVTEDLIVQSLRPVFCGGHGDDNLVVVRGSDGANK